MVKREMLVSLDPRETMERLVNPEHPVKTDTMEPLDLKVTPANLVLLEHLEKMGNLEHPATFQDQ